MKKIDFEKFLCDKCEDCDVVAEWEILTEDNCIDYYCKLLIGEEKGDYYLIKSIEEYISSYYPNMYNKCYKLSKNEFREYELKHSKFPDLARLTRYDMKKIFPHLGRIGYNKNKPCIFFIELIHKETKKLVYAYDFYLHNDCMYATLWGCGRSCGCFCLGEISKDFTFPKDSLLKVATQDYENYDFEIRTRKWFDSFKDK